MAKFPETFACYDTLTDKYISGARGQLVFASKGGLKKSVGQNCRYSNTLFCYSFLKNTGKEVKLITEYEHLVKDGAEEYNDPRREDLRRLEAKMAELVGASRWAVEEETAKYYKEAAKYSFKFDVQPRYVIHQIESVTIKEVK